jgi:hypothetical protein
MIQQVNLYQDKLKPNTDADLLKLYLSVFALIMALILGYCGYEFWENKNLANELEQASKKNTTAIARLQQIETQYPQQQINTLLIAEITLSKNRLRALRKIINGSSDTQSDQSQGFFRYFKALANQAHSDIWLSRIFVDSQNNTMTLQGSTFKSASVPSLLHRLQDETVFRGKKFARLAMKESTVQSNQIDFTISSQTNEEEALSP